MAESDMFFPFPNAIFRLAVGLSNILDNELNWGKPMEGFHR